MDFMSRCAKRQGERRRERKRDSWEDIGEEPPLDGNSPNQGSAGLIVLRQCGEDLGLRIPDS